MVGAKASPWFPQLLGRRNNWPALPERAPLPNDPTACRRAPRRRERELWSRCRVFGSVPRKGANTGQAKVRVLRTALATQKPDPELAKSARSPRTCRTRDDTRSTSLRRAYLGRIGRRLGGKRQRPADRLDRPANEDLVGDLGDRLATRPIDAVAGQATSGKFFWGRTFVASGSALRSAADGCHLRRELIARADPAGPALRTAAVLERRLRSSPLGSSRADAPGSSEGIRHKETKCVRAQRALRRAVL